MKIHSLKTLMNKTLDDVAYLVDYGSISESLYDAYYYLWYWSIFRHGEHYPPESRESIQSSLSPGNLLVFQEYMDRLLNVGKE